MTTFEIENLGTFTYNYVINSKKYNVISSCLFKASDVSNFNRYTVNLLKFKDLEIVKNKEFVFRLYYDESILQDEYIKKIWNKLNKYYQLVKYDCPKFKNNDGRHNGTFGTLMRLLPFHDFPQNDVNMVYIIDVDGNLKNKEKKLNLFVNFMNKYDLNLIYTYWYCHSPHHNINIENFVLGQLFLVKIKIPIDFLTNFINNVVENIFEIYKKLKNKITKQTDKKYHHKFFYGVDEIYNELYLKLYVDKNKIKYGRYVAAHYTGLYKILQEMFVSIKNENTKIKIQKIIQKLNKKFKTNYNDVFEFIDIFKDYDYKRKTNMYQQYEYFYKKIIKFYSKNMDLEKPNKFKCFGRIPKFIDDTNNLEIYN